MAAKVAKEAVHEPLGTAGYARKTAAQKGTKPGTEEPIWRWLPPWQRVLATERVRGTHASSAHRLQQIAHRCDKPE